jgi:tetratricopeptide (TPR) repeat protein
VAYHRRSNAGLKRFPKNASFKLGYVEWLLKRAETGDAKSEARAKQFLRAALVIDPSLSNGHYQLGNLALKDRRLRDVQSHPEEAVRLNPSNSQMHFALARLYRRLGRRQDADREMELYERLAGAGTPQVSRQHPIEMRCVSTALLFLVASTFLLPIRVA